jgi:hypothetical protein
MGTNQTWETAGWVTAPGEFPELLLKTFTLQADSVIDATYKTVIKLRTVGIEPMAVVRVVRTNPPWQRDEV